MDILPDRSQNHLAQYFLKLDRSQRLRVKYFVCDMWQPYVDLAHSFFPQRKRLLRQVSFHPASYMGYGKRKETSSKNHDCNDAKIL